MAIAADSCRVALLGRDDGARRQLRQALEDLGAAIAFEGEPAAVSGPAALGASLDVVIVSLEDGPDDALDHLETVLDDPGMKLPHDGRRWRRVQLGHRLCDNTC